MDIKEELLLALRDEKFAAEVSKMLKKQSKKKFTKEDNKVISNIRGYWNEKAVLKNKKLWERDKINILDAVKEHGVTGVYDIIDTAIKSPLNQLPQFKIYIQDLGWVMKPETLYKLNSGFYSKQNGKFKNKDTKNLEDLWG